MNRRNLAKVAVIAVLICFLGWALWIMLLMWTHIDVTISGHGWTALVLGVVFSCIVGFGLMRLLFLSSRGGYDTPPTFHRDHDDT